VKALEDMEKRNQTSEKGILRGNTRFPGAAACQERAGSSRSLLGNLQKTWGGKKVRVEVGQEGGVYQEALWAWGSIRFTHKKRLRGKGAVQKTDRRR